MSRRVTLKDIADEAGVSVMTVSNSLNGRTERVSEATIARVEDIARRRGYVASASARTLAARSSRLIGLLALAETAQRLSLSPYSLDVFGGVEHELRTHGFHLLFRGVSSISEVDIALRSWDLDGAILLGFPDDQLSEYCAPGETPLIALDSYSENSAIVPVRSADREGGRLAADHLLRNGHRRILFAGPEVRATGVVRERFDGFLQAFRDHGATWNTSDQATVEATHDAGYALGRALGADHPEVTAVFATADAIAIGIMNGARDRGLSLPTDLSVVGFDNLDVDSWVTPQLTTIDQDVSAKAADAAKILLSLMDPKHGSVSTAGHPVRLIERQSVASLSA